MSFITNLQRQQNSAVSTPAVVPQAAVPGIPAGGLAATFQDVNRFNVPVNSQFRTPDPALARYQLERNYRG